MEPAEVEIGGNDGQKSDAEQPSRNLQPPSVVDPQKFMHKPNVEGDAENEEEMDRPVNAEGKLFVGQNGNKGHVDVEEGTQKTDAGKQDVRPLFSTPKKRYQRETEQDDKSQNWRDDVC